MSEGFTKAQGYVASLRQMADRNYIDVDELRAAADCIEDLEELAHDLHGIIAVYTLRIEALEKALRQAIVALDWHDAVTEAITARIVLEQA